MQKTATAATETGRAAMAAGGAVLLARWNYSLATFYARRVERWWAYSLGLAQIRSPEQFGRSFLGFETDLLADYAEQAGELQQIALDRSDETANAPSETYETTLLKAQKDAALIIEQAKAQADRILRSAQSIAEQDAGGAEEPTDAAQMPKAAAAASRPPRRTSRRSAR